MPPMPFEIERSGNFLNQAKMISSLIVSLAAQYPYLCSKILLDSFKSESRFTLKVAFLFFGKKQLREVFPLILPRHWSQIVGDEPSKTNDDDEGISINALLDLYYTLINGVIERGPFLIENNPFGFLMRIPLQERKILLQEESPKTIALLALYLPVAQFNLIFEVCSPKIRKQTLIVLYHLELPSVLTQRQIASEIEDRFLQRRRHSQNRKNIFSLVVRSLRKLPAELANERLKEFEIEQPSLFEEIRSYYLSFDDVLALPSDLLFSVIKDLPGEVVARAFWWESRDKIERLVSKHSLAVWKMIESILLVPGFTPAPDSCLEAQKEIVLRVEEKLQQLGIKIEEVRKALKDQVVLGSQHDQQEC